MKGIQKRLGSLLMAAVMLLSLAVTPAMAADMQTPPTTAPTVSQGSGYFDYHKYAIDFTYSNSNWVEKISKIEIDGKEWTRVTNAFKITNETYLIRESDGQICFGDGFAADEVQCLSLIHI